MQESFAAQYIQEAKVEFRKLKLLAEKALAQISEAQLFATLDKESNSIAVIIKHMAGNMRSRWTDFLTSDGEKPDRHRDSEFEIDQGTTREWIMKSWEDGWRCLIGAIEQLTAADIGRTVLIRGQPHSVMQAVNRQLTHYACHVGQIVFLARHHAGEKWQSLSIPRGKSEQVNKAMWKKRERA
ncbi:MAG TPA: DUF1572 family protein [Acidobacteriota bacterium]|jgi:hypothetical protein